MRSFGREAWALAAVALVLTACGEPTRPRVGTLVVVLQGLPSGSNPQVSLVGPDDVVLSPLATTTYENLAPGSYSLVAHPVHASTAIFSVEQPEQSVVVRAGGRDSVTVTYRAITGSLNVNVAAPIGVTPRVRVTGPNGFDRLLLGGAFLPELQPGAYTFAPETVSARGFMYAGLNGTSTANVVAGTKPSSITVFIVAITGALAVDVRGLPPTGGDAAQVTGPNGFTRTVTTSTVLGNIAPGTYVVTPATTTFEGITYQAGTTAREINVNPGYTARAVLDFVPLGNDGGVLLNHRVDRLTLTQVVQREDNSIPMIAGRAALLRVFLVSSVAVDARPVARARFFRNGALVDSLTLTQPPAPTRTTIAPTDTGGTYDVMVPGALVQPGLAIQVEVDPAHEITEATRSDNVYPASPAAIEVRNGTSPGIRIVPVVQGNGLTGDVTEASKDVYLEFARRVYPLSGFNANVHAPYISTGSVLDAKDSSRAWSRILSEIEALRVAEGSLQNYYGLVKVTYRSGIAGIGYINGRSALGWDHLPTGAGVLAHELGHNYGRYHAPGCGAGGVDQAFPYPDGGIGGVGWDSAGARLWATSTPDLMSYCHPEWISDYTYEAVMGALERRQSASVVGASVEDCLVVWGRIENGVPVLEPAFTVRTRSALPARGGSHRVRALGAAGDELFSLSFEAQEIADLPESRAFAFAVPVSRLRGRALAELRLNAASGESRSVAPAAGVPDAEVRLQRTGAGRATLRWNDARYPLAVVRDTRTGEILALARRTGTALRVDRPDVELILSDRVRSVTRRATVAP